jgi:hypothetical protein
MNIPKFLFAVLIAFIFVFLFGWFFHDVLLKATYMQLPSAMLRPVDEFKARFGWLVAGQILLVLAFACVFAKGGFSGVGAGVKLGIKFGVFQIGTYLIAYAVHPYTLALIGYWSIGVLVEMAIAGAIVGAIYKPAPAPGT